MEIEEQLRSTSNQMLEHLEQLTALEAEKRTIPPGSRRFHKLAREVERLAENVVGEAEIQTDLSIQAAERHAKTGVVVPPVERHREVAMILAEWRDAERRAGAAKPGSADEAAIRAEVDRLRAEYQRAHRAATEPKRPL